MNITTAFKQTKKDLFGRVRVRWKTMGASDILRNEGFGEPLVEYADVKPIEKPETDLDYHDQSGFISHSAIQQFLASREMYQRRYVTKESPPKKSTKPMETGTIVHEFCLRNRAMDSFCGRYPKQSELPIGEFFEWFDKWEQGDKLAIEQLKELVDHNEVYQRATTNKGRKYASGDARPYDLYKVDGKLNGSAAKKFRKLKKFTNPEIEFWLNEREWDNASEAISALINQKDLWSWIHGEGVKREESFYWIDNQTGLKCRQQTDFHKELDDCVLVFDLKVTEFGSAREFARQWFDNGKKWMQPQHYSRGLFAHYQKPVYWCYITVKPSSCDKGHFTVRRHKGSISESMDSAYYSAYDVLMAEIANCYASNDWRELDAKGIGANDPAMPNQLNPRVFPSDILDLKRGDIQCQTA